MEERAFPKELYQIKADVKELRGSQEYRTMSERERVVAEGKITINAFGDDIINELLVSLIRGACNESFAYELKKQWEKSFVSPFPQICWVEGYYSGCRNIKKPSKKREINITINKNLIIDYVKKLVRDEIGSREFKHLDVDITWDTITKSK